MIILIEKIYAAKFYLLISCAWLLNLVWHDDGLANDNDWLSLFFLRIKINIDLITCRPIIIRHVHKIYAGQLL